MIINPPNHFNFNECLIFLNRDSQEILHKVEGNTLYKLLSVKDKLILFKVTYESDFLKVSFINTIPNKMAKKEIAHYIWDWFDLNRDLSKFYALAKKDGILAPLIKKYHGLRMIKINDLFETIVWAILGQQINLAFAYTLKKRFVEQFGENITYNGQTFWVFPSFNTIATLTVADLRALQITNRKSEYIIGIAQAMKHKEFSKASLLQMTHYDEVKKFLMKYRGIGAWSADYIMMKCLQFPNAFPIADVGLQNALKFQLNMPEKPSLEQLNTFSSKWEGWQAYATLYLWRSLYDT